MNDQPASNRSESVPNSPVSGPLRRAQGLELAETVRSPLSIRVGAKAARKLKARRRSAQGVWFGLGMMGLIGWSVVVPTLLGAALGLWLDHHYPGKHSYTLALLVAGVVLGCFNAWNWVSKEEKAMRQEQEDDND